MTDADKIKEAAINNFGKIQYSKGQKIHNVIFLEEVYSEKDRKAKFLCSCGNEFTAWIHSVKSNVTKSCGCFRKSYMKQKQTKHGYSTHPLYNTYNNMIERCYTTTNISFADYGGRGVSVCEEWRNNFTVFYEWAINNGWAEGLQIDKDINGDGMLYSPDNCCFVSCKQNCNKRRTSRILEYNGVAKTLSQWSEQVGISSATLFARLKMGWGIEKALTAPLKYNYVS